MCTAAAPGSVKFTVVQALSATSPATPTNWGNPGPPLLPPRSQQHGCRRRFFDSLYRPTIFSRNHNLSSLRSSPGALLTAMATMAFADAVASMSTTASSTSDAAAATMAYGHCGSRGRDGHGCGGQDLVCCRSRKSQRLSPTLLAISAAADPVLDLGRSRPAGAAASAETSAVTLPPSPPRLADGGPGLDLNCRRRLSAATRLARSL